MKIDLTEYADLVALMQLAAQLESEQKRIFEALPVLYGRLEEDSKAKHAELSARSDEIAGQLFRVSKRLDEYSIEQRQEFARLEKEIAARQSEHAEYARRAESEIPAPVEKKIRALFAEIPKPKDGAPGERGAPGRDFNLAESFRGNWDKGTSYNRGDTCTFRGSFYLVLQDVRGVLPTVKSQTEANPYYAAVAISGAPGLPGAGADAAGGGINWVSAPASASASGTAGQVAYSATHFYVCTATNTWRRVTLASW